MFEVVIWEEVEELRVRIRQELIVVESVAYGVVLNPLPFLALSSRSFLLLNVVSEPVIADDIGIGPLGVLDEVGVVIVLGRSFYDVALVG